MERYNINRSYAKVFFRFLTEGITAEVFKDIHEIDLQNVITDIINNLSDEDMEGPIDSLIETIEYSINDYITFINYEPHIVSLFFDGTTSLAIINGKCYIEDGFYYDNERKIVEKWAEEYYVENKGHPTRIIIFFIDVFRRNVPLRVICEGL